MLLVTGVSGCVIYVFACVWAYAYARACVFTPQCAADEGGSGRDQQDQEAAVGAILLYLFCQFSIQVLQAYLLGIVGDGQGFYSAALMPF